MLILLHCVDMGDVAHISEIYAPSKEVIQRMLILLHCVDMGDVAHISEIYAPSIFMGEL
jgi:hypothetical protein